MCRCTNGLWTISGLGCDRLRVNLFEFCATYCVWFCAVFVTLCVSEKVWFYVRYCVYDRVCVFLRLCACVCLDVCVFMCS